VKLSLSLMAKKSNKVNPYLLCVMGGALLAAAFLMGPFPVLIFAGMAPLFAIADHAEGEFFWNKLELIAAALFIGFFAAHATDSVRVVPALLQAIAFTLGFACFNFTRQSLGTTLGRLPLIAFLLALEYVGLKTGAGPSMIFLADALRFKAEWVRWTSETGYLGISLWILAANHLLYLGLFRNGWSPLWLMAFLVVVIGPVIYSYTLDTSGIDKATMLELYSGNAPDIGPYSLSAEWILRTAAWISVLVLVFAFVKGYIQKK
jgi:hypothetical protein